MWQLFCVSVAAQIGTFALTIFYFNQFPTYFWLSNFLVFPAAYLILAGTFLLLILSPVSWLAVPIAKLLAGVTFSTTFLLQKIALLPYSLVENISLTSVELFLLISMGATFIFFIKFKNKGLLFGTSVLLLGFLLFGLSQKLSLLNQKKYIIYAREQSIHLINGRKNYLICPEVNQDLPTSIHHAVRELKLDSPTIIYLDSCKQFASNDLIIDKQFILFLNQTFQYNETKNHPKTQHNEMIESDKSQPEGFDPASETKIDSVMRKGTILNLANLRPQQTIIADL